jgi:hypothetical protein
LREELKVEGEIESRGMKGRQRKLRERGSA